MSKDEKDAKSQPDDLDATRQLAALLEPFSPGDRERIIRWAREKLGMAVASGASAPGSSPSVLATAHGHTSPTAPTAPNDLRNFVASKRPKNDTQFAAIVAYFHRFVAPEASRKESISPQDLLDACRIADWKRPARPRQTMLNAFTAGVFDKSGHGSYKLNPVGENLVAMVLPSDGAVAAGPVAATRKAPVRKKSSKNQARKRRGSR